MLARETTTLTSRNDLEIGAVTPYEMESVLGVLTRGMRDNPLHIAAFGTDPAHREPRNRHLFAMAASRPDYARHMLVARNGDGQIVGVCGMTAPGSCLPTTSEKLRMLPSILKLGPGSAKRLFSWLGAWSRHDPQTAHWHFGPLAVDAHLQGQGIGSAMMRVFCAQMDAAGADAYLETDREINVRFYRKFGFEVVGEEQVLGTANWFMIRKPKLAS